jgi:hypothetical protein
MYSSEYLRNKKAAQPQVVSPTRVRDSGFRTQIYRYQNSMPKNVQMLSGGQRQLASSEGFTNARAGAAVCCGPAQETITTEGQCCDQVIPYLTPRNFYNGKAQDCCVVNGEPIGPAFEPCCPDLPKNSPLVTWRKRPQTQG